MLIGLNFEGFVLQLGRNSLAIDLSLNEKPKLATTD
jgi:hypothetical protein